MTVVSLRDVWKSFSASDGTQRPVLRGINLDVQRGDRIGIIGPSGGGKSTLLRTINALETIDRGEITVNGLTYRMGKNPRPVRRQTAMVFQRFELFPHLTVLENVTLALRYVAGKKRDEAESLALQWLERMGLGVFAHSYPMKLSGGQQQRVALVRALVLEPAVLLCDEPTSALDPELRREVLDALAEVSRDLTVILVTHEMDFVRRFANRILFLDGGEIAAAGPPDILAYPDSPRLKAFLCRG